jgi:hypothetical protein
MNDTVTKRLDTADLEARVTSVHDLVALEPGQTSHFETSRGLGEHLGYPAADPGRGRPSWPSRATRPRGLERSPH